MSLCCLTYVDLTVTLGVSKGRRVLHRIVTLPTPALCRVLVRPMTLPTTLQSSETSQSRSANWACLARILISSVTNGGMPLCLNGVQAMLGWSDRLKAARQEKSLERDQPNLQGTAIHLQARYHELSHRVGWIWSSVNLNGSCSSNCVTLGATDALHDH